MSSRALRKLQREQELQKQHAAATDDQESDSEDNISESLQKEDKPRNAYDLLEDIEDEDSDEVGPENEANTTRTSNPFPDEETNTSKITPAVKPRKKKKKARKKPKDKQQEGPATQKEESGDEIDRALREIAAKGTSGRDTDSNTPNLVSWEASATKLLAVDSKSFNPVNEMKSLFGNIAVEGGESRPGARNQRRREANTQGGVDLSTALTGRYNIASRGKELGSLASRRNVFMQGKEEWPLATSGGLSMEHIPDSQSFERHYNVIHNEMYQEAQMLFRLTVESMDPQRMIALLAHHPYHIVTLLQVSEIAKHQGDHSVSGDLLERALFSLGRSVHSSFPSALREGTARLNFNKSENRELYLTVWRYIKNLEMRGTWRTAFEWAKVLLQFNTLSDPFGVTLMIDQLALRGRQQSQLIELTSATAYGNAWRYLPNIQISLTLALLRSGQPRDARRQLAIAMNQYPYILSALASELDISPLPKALWAKVPSTDAEKLYTQLYVIRAKDLWNTPETTALIVEVAETLGHYTEAIKATPIAPKLEISLEDARHIMLLEIPTLIALLPRQFTNMHTSSFDILPPPDSSRSDFVARAPGDNSSVSMMQNILSAAESSTGATGGVLQRILDWFHTPTGPNGSDDTAEAGTDRPNLRAPDGTEIPRDMIENLIRMHLDEADDDHNRDDRPGMAGDWDYYEEPANAQTSSEDEVDSMPELESLPEDQNQAITTQRNPHAAMVEEDSDEDEAGQPQSQGMGGTAVLRHVDSDEEEYIPTVQSRVPPQTQPITTPALNTVPQPPVSSSDADPEVDETDPQRIQRWLVSSGLSDLQSNPSRSMGTYVRRLKMLRKQQQDWILNVIRQRAGQELADRVRSALT